jgi:hypothetical protein
MRITKSDELVTAHESYTEHVGGLFTRVFVSQSAVDLFCGNGRLCNLYACRIINGVDNGWRCGTGAMLPDCFTCEGSRSPRISYQHSVMPRHIFDVGHLEIPQADRDNFAILVCQVAMSWADTIFRILTCPGSISTSTSTP